MYVPWVPRPIGTSFLRGLSYCSLGGPRILSKSEEVCFTTVVEGGPIKVRESTPGVERYTHVRSEGLRRRVRVLGKKRGRMPFFGYSSCYRGLDVRVGLGV